MAYSRAVDAIFQSLWLVPRCCPSTAGKALLGLYRGKVAVGSGHGTAGSLVVLTVWVYYSAVIFYFGAKFTHSNWCLRRDAEAVRAHS